MGQESSSLTMSLYALMGSCVMDTTDNIKVITVDIPDVFIKRDWSQDDYPRYIMFERILIDMICEINPAFHDMII